MGRLRAIRAAVRAAGVVTLGMALVSGAVASGGTVWALLAGPAAAQEAPDQRPRLRPETLGPAADAAAPEPVAAQGTAAPEAAPEPSPEPALALASPADDPADFAAVAPGIGPETNLPLPRFVSLKTDEGNVRRGPSLSHRIDWVFTREDMPLQVTAEYGHWRRVIDREGLGGWVHYSLLSGTRTVIVDQDMLPLLTRPEPDANVNALLELGVIARLHECEPDWCRISAGGYRGWVRKTAVWGVGPDEVLD